MWIELPAIYGKWNSVYRMHLRWAKRGLWTRILRILAEGGRNGGLLSMDASFFAAHILAAGGFPNIPSREGTLDPLPYHKDLGKLRHVVENFFCRLKRARRVGTRYDRLPATFTAFVTPAILGDWLRF